MPWRKTHRCNPVEASLYVSVSNVWRCPGCKKQWVMRYYSSPYGSAGWKLYLEELDKDKRPPIGIRLRRWILNIKSFAMHYHKEN